MRRLAHTPMWVRQRTVMSFTALVTVFALLTGTAGAETGSDEVPELDETVAALVAAAGFTRTDDLDATGSVPAPVSVDLGGLSIGLPELDDAVEYTDGVTSIVVADHADGLDVVVVDSDGFGIITDVHDQVEYRFAVTMTTGTTLTEGPAGRLVHHETVSGEVLGMIDPAVAIDETGAYLPAAYSYDAATGELVLNADLTDAVGTVLIDPSWRCWAAVATTAFGWLILWVGTHYGWWAALYWLPGAIRGLTGTTARYVYNACT